MYKLQEGGLIVRFQQGRADVPLGLFVLESSSIRPRAKGLGAQTAAREAMEFPCFRPR
jgi:hypothetical protein